MHVMQGRPVSAPSASHRALTRFLAAAVGPCYRCLCAFVTVESQKGRAFLLKKYSQGPVGRLFQAKALRFRGTHALRLEAAMEPTNVMWENLQYGALSRLARRSVSALVAFVLLLITTGFVVGATLYEKSLPPVVDCAGTERAGVLPCDLMWALNATTSNADTARGKVKGLGDAVDGNTCSIYVNPNNNIWGVNYVRRPHTRPPLVSPPQIAS